MSARVGSAASAASRSPRRSDQRVRALSCSPSAISACAAWPAAPSSPKAEPCSSASFSAPRSRSKLTMCSGAAPGRRGLGDGAGGERVRSAPDPRRTARAARSGPRGAHPAATAARTAPRPRPADRRRVHGLAGLLAAQRQRAGGVVTTSWLIGLASGGQGRRARAGRSARACSWPSWHRRRLRWPVAHRASASGSDGSCAARSAGARAARGSG